MKNLTLKNYCKTLISAQTLSYQHAEEAIKNKDTPSKQNQNSLLPNAKFLGKGNSIKPGHHHTHHRSSFKDKSFHPSSKTVRKRNSVNNKYQFDLNSYVLGDVKDRQMNYKDHRDREMRENLARSNPRSSIGWN